MRIETRRAIVHDAGESRTECRNRHGAILLDAAEAAKSVKLVRQMWKVANWEIPYRVFFTRVPPAIRERTARDIEQQFSGASVPVLPATLVDRAAYRTCFPWAVRCMNWKPPMSPVWKRPGKMRVNTRKPSSMSSGEGAQHDHRRQETRHA